ncbi:MAG: hypothetical protein ACI8RD_007901 [Bacillariaceae sp.]
MKRSHDYKGCYGGIRYRYSADTIAKAIKKRDGSTFEWFYNKQYYSFDRPETPTTLENLDEATTTSKKTKVLTHALKFTSDFELGLLVKKATKADLKLTLQGGIMDGFKPVKLLELLEATGAIA